MAALCDTSDGDLARAIGTPSSAPAADHERELYRRFAPRVRLYGLRHLRDDDAALDLVQQVMLTTIEKLRAGSIRDTDQIASFILGTSRQMATDVRRRDRRRQRLRDTYLSTTAVTLPAADERLDLDRLEHCLAALAERERSVILLTFYAGKTGPEVGRDLQLAPGHVRVIRHRAIDRLRRCVESGEVAS